jgi:nucleotide-binding universal stress UspA family protein
MYKHILIPTDGSPLSEEAVRQGTALAKSLGAKTTVITVSPRFHTLAVEPAMVVATPEEYERECEAVAEKVLGTAEGVASESGVVFRGLHVVHDHPYAAIIEAAQTNRCDLICMASHGRKGLSALILGSETTKVLTHSKIPVLVCR